MRGCNSFTFKEDLVQTTIRPESFRPAFDNFRQMSDVKGVLSNHKEVNCFKLRDAFDTIRIFFRNKIN